MTDSDRAGYPVLEERDASTIGVVQAVSPIRVDVAVLREAPHGTGLQEGTFHRFPRLNSYVVLPSERGSILAIVTWLGIDEEHGPPIGEPDRIGLPTPRRRLQALPLGVLRRKSSLLSADHGGLALDRGVLLFPTPGDPVRLPTKAEAAAAVPGVADGRPTLHVGRAPLAGDAVVRVDPDRLFGRHFAVLGNTGSGKSCTVAQLLRQAAKCGGDQPSGFRAIVIDPNGEYRSAFDDLDGVSVHRFSVSPQSGQERQLRVPAWLWNYQEWLSFADASGKSQAPQLRRALHLLRTTDLTEQPTAAVSLVSGRLLVSQFRGESIEQMATANALSRLDNVCAACDELVAASAGATAVPFTALKARIISVLAPRRDLAKGAWKFGVGPLNQAECATLADLFDSAIDAVGLPDLAMSTQNVDVPRSFDPDDLLYLLPILAAASGPEVVGWVTPMVERLRIALADERLRLIASWIDDETLDGLLVDYFSAARDSQIAVVDLSLRPPVVVLLRRC